MKAILEFKLPEERSDFNCAVNAGNYVSVLTEMDDHLRKLDKYGGVELISLPELRDRFNEMLKDSNVDLYGE